MKALELLKQGGATLFRRGSGKFSPYLSQLTRALSSESGIKAEDQLAQIAEAQRKAAELLYRSHGTNNIPADVLKSANENARRRVLEKQQEELRRAAAEEKAQQSLREQNLEERSIAIAKQQKREQQIANRTDLKETSADPLNGVLYKDREPSK